MTTTSRAAKLKGKLKGVVCPKCKKPRLVQRRPRDYKTIRCLNCGTLLVRRKKK